MAQDEQSFDSSDGLDLVVLYDSQTVDSEIESDVIRSLLDANGIPSVVSSSPFPNVGFQVKVPRALLADAQRVVDEAEEVGPQGAAEAEAATEEER
ncbi:MAG TPA: hypothetical protein VGF59_15205 [Bryobacteraceae bacterium]|jgi:hypothetical protein